MDQDRLLFAAAPLGDAIQLKVPGSVRSRPVTRLAPISKLPKITFGNTGELGDTGR